MYRWVRGLFRALWCAICIAFSTAAVVLFLPSVAVAGPSQLAFPTKPVRWIIPLPPGGSLDLIARIVGNKLSQVWGRPIVVDNRPGAATIIGTQIAAEANPDGYTEAFLVSATLTSNPSLHKHLPYDPQKSFIPITVVASTSQLLVENPALPPKTVTELIAYAKARPGKLNYGSAGVGGSLHLAMELLKSMTGIDVVHIPYRGGPPAVRDLEGGRIALLFFNTPAALPHVRSGRVRALGISSLKRSPLLPGVPTISESGVPGFQTSVWYGLLAPTGTPKSIIRKVHDDVVAVIARPEVRRKLLAIGADPVGDTPKDFARLIKVETAKWARIIRAARIPAS